MDFNIDFILEVFKTADNNWNLRITKVIGFSKFGCEMQISLRSALADGSLPIGSRRSASSPVA